MENMVLDDKLKHLSLKEVESLISEYYGETTVAELVDKYNINIDSSRLFSIFPPI